MWMLPRSSRLPVAAASGALLLGLTGGLSPAGPVELFHAQGEMAGEVTTSTVILQSRLTAVPGLMDGDVPGAPGWGKFQISGTADFGHPRETAWIEATAANDFILKSKISGLEPGRSYHYRLVYGAGPTGAAQTGPARRFKTQPKPEQPVPVRFVVGNCMNYAFYFDGPKGGGAGMRTDPSDRELGYPAMESILKLDPDFFVGAGDNVYYDHPRKTAAKTQSELRRKWHEQFVLPRVVNLMGGVASYWMKDDHDYRFNDSDPFCRGEPSHELGIRTFREQMPVVDPAETGAVTYRTQRCGKWLQIWMVEGRDYRSPNSMPDGPDKSIWGPEQKAWLRSSLLTSDAAFKILISPTPLIGPDDGSKKDNHTNRQGFRREGEEFFGWLKENKVKDVFIVTGDRHWHYHSVHPSGYEEFACGALNTENSRLGRKPGDRQSTDPDALVRQLYTDAKATGGYLLVEVRLGTEPSSVQARFCIQDEWGRELYAHTATAVAGAN